MTPPQRLDTLEDDLKAIMPPLDMPAHIHQVMARATRELIDSGAAGRALKAGDEAPEFALETPDGQRLSSATLLARGPLIVSFYRGVWCPHCNRELQALQRALPLFEMAGARLVAISPQTRVNSRKSVRENALSFPILSDPRNDVAATFGLRFALPGDLAELYQTLGIALPAFNGDASWTLPLPSRFVIGRNRVIQYAEVNPDYTRRPDPLDMLAVVRRIALHPR